MKKRLPKFEEEKIEALLDDVGLFDPIEDFDEIMKEVRKNIGVNPDDLVEMAREILRKSKEKRLKKTK